MVVLNDFGFSVACFLSATDAREVCGPSALLRRPSLQPWSPTTGNQAQSR